jgi:hypothetical protein
MDASDDREIKLQRKANDLLSDLDRSLKRCLWSGASKRTTQLQSAVRTRDVDRLIGLVNFLWDEAALIC